jgi:hypothetical protein
MIRHVVLAKFRVDVSDTQREAIFDSLRALRDKIDGLVAMGFSANVSPEGLNKGFTHGFTMDFRDEAARDAYLVHPDHKAAGGVFVAALEGGRDGGLIVLDLKI